MSRSSLTEQGNITKNCISTDFRFQILKLVFLNNTVIVSSTKEQFDDSISRIHALCLSCYAPSAFLSTSRCVAVAESAVQLRMRRSQLGAV